MMLRVNSFNGIARYYDFLKGLVFGRSIYESEVRFLTLVPPGGKVLIIGGGTGEILSALIELNPDAEVWFVEASSEMLNMAEKRMREAPARKVRFIHGTHRDVPDVVLFDAVITNFFLDLFSPAKARHLCTLINRKMAADGVWLLSDFVNTGKYWHRILLWTMYRFFRLTSGIVAKELPPWERHVTMAGMEEVSSTVFYGGFIRSAAYRKVPASRRKVTPAS